jgi:hypothetical protein
MSVTPGSLGTGKGKPIRAIGVLPSCQECAGLPFWAGFGSGGLSDIGLGKSLSAGAPTRRHARAPKPRFYQMVPHGAQLGWAYVPIASYVLRLSQAQPVGPDGGEAGGACWPADREIRGGG